MNREQFKNLRRVLRKLLQGNGKIDEPCGRRWGANAGIEEAYYELMDVIGGKYGYFAMVALSNSLTVQTWYGWTDGFRRLRFAKLRLEMWERSHARLRAAYAAGNAPSRHIGVFLFQGTPLRPHVHTTATTGPAL